MPVNKEFEKAYIAYAGTPIPCLLCDGFSTEADKKRLQKFYEAGQQSVKNELAAVQYKHSLADISNLNLDDPSDRLKWFYAIIGDIDKASKKEDLRDEDFLEIFEEIYSANRSKWIPVTERLPTKQDGPEIWVRLRGEKDYRYNCISVITCDTKGKRRETPFDLDANKFLFIIDPIIKWQPLPEV